MQGIISHPQPHHPLAMNHPHLAKFAIFDVDGLLLDTECIYTQVTRQITDRFGKTFDWSIKGNMIGRPQLDAARYLVNTLDLPISAEQYLAERNILLRQAFIHNNPLPGAERLIRNLHRNRIPVAVATSSDQEMFEIKTTRHQAWFSLFDVVVTGDDAEVEQGKPAPDIFLVAARRLVAAPEETLVFEDAPSGLAAGLAAGMRVIAVPDPNMDPSRYRGAEQLLDSLEDFQPAIFGIEP